VLDAIVAHLGAEAATADEEADWSPL
jgi:hypothetical protein